jgi:5-methylcytosine-specific restriction enzyme A
VRQRPGATPRPPLLGRRMKKRSRLTTLKPSVPILDSRVRQSDRPVEPLYTSADWRALVATLIQLRGHRCQDPHCKKPDRCAGGRLFGDHIIELRDGGARLHPGNVMLRCGSCHTRKTNAEREKRQGR